MSVRALVGAVMCVVTVVVVGVIWGLMRRLWKNRRPLTPLERIEAKGCLGWLKLKFDPAGAKVWNLIIIRTNLITIMLIIIITLSTTLKMPTLLIMVLDTKTPLNYCNEFNMGDFGLS